MPAQKNLRQALSSWKTLSVILLSFASGMPLGLVWLSIPDALKSSGIEIQYIGLLAIAQLPWSLKPLWAPLMARYSLPLLSKRRGWILFCQIGLLLSTFSLCFIKISPDTLLQVGFICFAIALFSASQDIALDGYAVELLNKDEQSVVVGGRVAVYRAAMYVAGSLSITLASFWSWQVVYALLACTYLPMMLITVFSPEPPESQPEPKSVVEAFFQPLKELLTRPLALEIILFVTMYKFSDNLGQALLRPFLEEMGYNAIDRGVALGTIGLTATLVGTFLGGMITAVIGLGYSLWVFGVLQIFSNVGYLLICSYPPTQWLMYSSMGFESLAQGLGTGAFSVLMMRLTQKRFSVTQYAVLSSLFSLPRVFTGPLAGYLIKPLGWKFFFVLTMVAGIPGLMLLQRFSPMGEKDPQSID